MFAQRRGVGAGCGRRGAAPCHRIRRCRPAAVQHPEPRVHRCRRGFFCICIHTVPPQRLMCCADHPTSDHHLRSCSYVVIAPLPPLPLLSNAPCLQQQTSSTEHLLCLLPTLKNLFSGLQAPAHRTRRSSYWALYGGRRPSGRLVSPSAAPAAACSPASRPGGRSSCSGVLNLLCLVVATAQMTQSMR